MAQTEGIHGAEWLICEAEESSLEVVTLVSGQDIVSGTVLGAICTGAVTRTAASGDGTISAFTFGAATQAGTYTFTFLTTGATATAQITAPDGHVLPGILTVGTAYLSDHFNVTFSDGGTDFDNNDIVTLAVTKKYSLHDNAATDGSQAAIAIAFNDCDASAADKSCLVVVRNAEVVESKLTWKSGISAANKAAAIANLSNQHIIVRT